MTPEQMEITRRILREVAAMATPPLKPSRILTGDTRHDDYHISRLRGIVAMRLEAAGIDRHGIANVFGQSYGTTLHQMEAARRWRHLPRFTAFFTLTPKSNS